MILVRRWVISVSLPFLLETSLKWGGQCSVWDENLPDWRSFELWPGCILHHNVCKNLPTTICIVKATVFPVVMYGCESWTLKKGWVPKNWHFRNAVLEKMLESPLDCKEIKPVNSKGSQSWIYIGRTDAKAEAPILWPPDSKSRLIGEDLDAEKGWRQEEKGTTEDELVGWHHCLHGHELEQAPGNGERQESLACCSPWGRKESDTTEQLNNNLL